MGFSAMLVTLGSIMGPLIAGVLADQTGDYRLGFTIVAGIAVSGIGFWVCATPPDPPIAIVGTTTVKTEL